MQHGDLSGRRRLGATELQVAPICLGGNVFGWTADDPASFAVLDAYAGLGGNFVDSADVYSAWVPGHSGGESEALLGRWMRARGNRDRVVLVTKVGSRMGSGPDDVGLGPAHIAAAVESSLRRLQTDYIDIYLAHHDDLETPQEATLDAFTRLVQQGKVRHIGVSNFSADRLASALAISAERGLARYTCAQPRYNLLSREDYEGALATLCREADLGVMTYGALAGGFLTGKYRPNSPTPDTLRAESVARRSMTEAGFAVLAVVDRVATAHDATPAQVALAWLLAHPGITTPIASATSPVQLRELAGATALDLTPEELGALAAAGG